VDVSRGHRDVATVGHLDATIYPPDGIEETSVFTIVDEGGVLRVAQHDFFVDL
jgi:hypothetical protein